MSLELSTLISTLDQLTNSLKTVSKTKRGAKRPREESETPAKAPKAARTKPADISETVKALQDLYSNDSTIPPVLRNALAARYCQDSGIEIDASIFSASSSGGGKGEGEEKEEGESPTDPQEQEGEGAEEPKEADIGATVPPQQQAPPPRPTAVENGFADNEVGNVLHGMFCDAMENNN